MIDYDDNYVHDCKEYFFYLCFCFLSCHHACITFILLIYILLVKIHNLPNNMMKNIFLTYYNPESQFSLCIHLSNVIEYI